MTVKSAPRVVSMLTAVLLAVGGVLAASVPAQAATGSPPATQDKRVLGAVHTDAVAGFVDDGRLVVDTMADVDGQLAKRLDTDSLIFNLTGGQTTVPNNPLYSFLGDAGATVWMAPQTQNTSLIWPGFSTQASSLINAIGITGTVGFDLTGFQGPSAGANLEVFLNDFGTVERIYSIKDGLSTWSRTANQHTHVNWAFSEPGRYVLTFTLSATVNGTAQTASQDYIFFVGNIADYPTVTTTTAVSVSASEVTTGSPVDLSATVTPASAEGYVQFFDGTTSLGWEHVADGQASLSGVVLSAGSRSVTAKFTPTWSQEYKVSTSPAKTVTVADAVVVNTTAPVLSGTPAVGQVLTVTAGSWTPTPDGVSFQWLRDGSPINGATGDSYQLAGADSGHDVSARVTATKTGYQPGVATTGAVRVDALTNTTAPTISGDAAAFTILTATPGAWSPEPDALAYQWLRSGEPIDGAMTDSYTTGAGDIGAEVSVRVTATKAGFEPASATSEPVTVTAAAFTSVQQPTVSGTFSIGHILTVSEPVSDPVADSYAHQWLRDGEAISGATGTSYETTAADVGHELAVRVTATKAGYQDGVATSAGQQVAEGDLAVVTDPTLTGTAEVGATLTVTDGTWEPEPDVVSVEWLRDGEPIGGATGSQYTVTVDDAGHTISARVIASLEGYADSRVGLPGQLVPLLHFDTVTASITGSGKVGEALTATGAATPGMDAFTYQWSRGGAPIDGATTGTYTPQPGDLGEELTVTATATKTGYAPAPSAPSAAVTVTPGDLTATTAPAIAGPRAVGGTLTVSTGTWNTPVTLSGYQWSRDGEPIDGATTATYTPSIADAGTTLTLTATATATGYTDAPVTTAGVVIDQQPLIDAPDALDEEEFTEQNQGDLEATLTGTTATVTFPDGAVTDGEWVYVYGYSTPTPLGWHQVTDGAITVNVASLGSGEHTLAVYALNGDLIGWAGITLAAAPTDDDPDTAAPAGERLATTGGGDATVTITAALLLLAAGGGLFLTTRRRSVGADPGR